MKRVWELVTSGPGRTHAVGRALGRVLQPGDVVALAGPLGAGKTHFVQGLAAGLNVPAGEPVVSPTFVLVREYIGRLKLYHIDAYRLTGPGELLALGFEEMLAEPGSVVVVEWADRTRPAIPARACWVRLDHVAPTRRRIRITWPAARRLAAAREGLSRRRPNRPRRVDTGHRPRDTTRRSCASGGRRRAGRP